MAIFLPASAFVLNFVFLDASTFLTAPLHRHRLARLSSALGLGEDAFASLTALVTNLPVPVAEVFTLLHDLYDQLGEVQANKETCSLLQTRVGQIVSIFARNNRRMVKDTHDWALTRACLDIAPSVAIFKFFLEHIRAQSWWQAWIFSNYNKRQLTLVELALEDLLSAYERSSGWHKSLSSRLSDSRRISKS
ncbi:hypothetical protein EXIGLDRAFT_756096 [Exidia glandulosa HHB12029]|uniref:Uncharacterized protein n=1 Tax=Exidia glandulosa HHB12029 TaxID=1314781 RepID=A0A165BIR4_EXIGL|nr:hypothetical protein EXIGLDRAFT_756096 [Exidia glandulosa HHB12029]